MGNPVLIELTRGALVESRHAGAIALVRATGERVAGIGEIEAPIFPRSAIKPLQALPLLETGAADRFGFGPPQIALACGSHAGTLRHVAVVEGMLTAIGLAHSALACGAHAPIDGAAAQALAVAAIQPSPLHHNCSGKHAGMLATARHKGEPIEGYGRPDHPVQARIERTLAELSGCDLGADACGIDGCSVPNWAMATTGLALAFARLATGEGLEGARAEAAARVVAACWAHPELVAGPGRLDTLLMQRLPGKLLVKAGAEGVYAGALPEHGLGFALKIDDGAKRAAEAAVVALIARFYPQARNLGPSPVIASWQGTAVGEMRPSPALSAMLSEVAP
jgi:L-asparaginase II